MTCYIVSRCTCTRVLEVYVGNSDSVDGMASVKPAGQRAHQRCRRPGTWRAESSCQRSALSSTLRAKHRAPCIPAYQVSGAYCNQTTPPCETSTLAIATLCAACKNSVRNITCGNGQQCRRERSLFFIGSCSTRPKRQRLHDLA